jgi:hypothetical protein
LNIGSTSRNARDESDQKPYRIQVEVSAVVYVKYKKLVGKSSLFETTSALLTEKLEEYIKCSE